MAQDYTITQAYPVIVKATGEQKSFEAHGNKFLVWRLFFEGADGYFLNNRKEDNPPQKGDIVYGSIGEDRFGNATFKSESKPLGYEPKQTTQSQNVSSAVEEKLDYIISLLENMSNKEESEEAPVDLSKIPF